jgi:hypothetical protein
LHASAAVQPFSRREAKDTDDDLEKEIKAKFAAGCPRDNILFQGPRRAILYQNGERFMDADLASCPSKGFSFPPPNPQSLPISGHSMEPNGTFIGRLVHDFFQPRFSPRF